jgi:hypothetical protein
MSTPKRRRVYEVVERQVYPYFEPGDKVKIEEYIRDCPPKPLPIQREDAPLDVFTVKEYLAPASLNYDALLKLEEFPDEFLDAEYFMPADWNDEEWEASADTPLIVNRPIVPAKPNIKLGFTSDDEMALARIYAQLMGLHTHEIEFFDRLKEREAELENLARTQVENCPDES